MDIISKKKESDFRNLPLYKVRIDYKNQGYVNCHKMEPIHIKDFWMYLKKYNIKEYNKSKTNESLYKGFIQILEETQKPIRIIEMMVGGVESDGETGTQTRWDGFRKIEVRKEE